MAEKVEFPVKGELVQCTKCERKILIERALFGIDHTFGTQTTCGYPSLRDWECLDDNSRKWAIEKYKLKNAQDRV